MQMVLVGPRQGKTINLAGFRFVNGVANIPDDAPDAINLLRNFHEAHPAHLIERSKDGKTLSVRDDEAHVLDFVPQPLDGPVPIPDGKSSGGPPQQQMQPVVDELDALTKDELMSQASQMGLPTNGNKVDILARIRAVKP